MRPAALFRFPGAARDFDRELDAVDAALGKSRSGVKARILLRRTADGAERWADPHPGQAAAPLWDWPNPSWTEGNFSCDCNRGDFFGDDSECGESAYRIVMVEAEDGRVLMDGEDGRREVEQLEEMARAIPETGAPDSYLRARGAAFLLGGEPAVH